MPIARIGAGPIFGGVGDLQAPGDQEQKKKEKDKTAYESPFFGQHREDEVGVLFGQEVKLALRSFEEPFAEDGSRAHGDLGLSDMVAGLQRVEVGVDER